MHEALEISLAPERLEDGLPEERAAFGMLAIRAGSVCLTQGYDFYIDGLRDGPLVSAYHAAEWFAWNWWRLMYEPSSHRSGEWWRAHCMTSIGEGYTWPPITIRGDGVRSAVIASPSSDPNARPFRYLGAAPWIGSRTELEAAIDAFIPRVLDRLERSQLKTTNLHRLWTELLDERSDRESTRSRRLEALLGKDPDEADETILVALMADAAELGETAVDELAADAREGRPATADRLHGIADRDGTDARRTDAISLTLQGQDAVKQQIVAWRKGAAAAHALRQQESLGASPITSGRLCRMLGTSETLVQKRTEGAPLSFALTAGHGVDRIVLRSKWDEGRRFDLARLLGDRLLFDANAPMLPVTQAYTYRQRAQRSFAAELLAPFESVEAMLHGDFSPDLIREVAEHYDVSSMTIATMLRNHGLMERDELAEAA